MELVTNIKLDEYEKLALNEGLGVLTQYCNLVSCRHCTLRDFCNFSSEVDTFVEQLTSCIKPLLE